MNFYGMPIIVSWKVYLSDIIKIFNKAIKGSINELHISKIRDILYKIFITNINGTEIIKELLNQMLLNLKDKELTYKIIDKCIIISYFSVKNKEIET